jgi:hypothetical protein
MRTRIRRSNKTDGRPLGRPWLWMERAIGLGLVLVSLMLFYGMTVPGLLGSPYAIALFGAVGVLGTMSGMPLLVTGRFRQRR